MMHYNAQGGCCHDTVTKLLLSFECDRELLSLGIQRLAFHFPLPSAALGSSWNIPGDQLSAPAHPCLLG